MYNKYVLFIPQGGINDCFNNIYNTLFYCIRNKRTLLLDMTNSAYHINFSDYFDINNTYDIIYDSNKIKDILTNLKISNTLDIFPNNLDLNILDLFTHPHNIRFNWQSGKPYFTYKNVPLYLPTNTPNNVILHSRCGGGDGFLFLKHVILKENIKIVCREKMALLGKKYLCIHVRNTDLQCNYIQLYKKNMKYIHSFSQIYICTDDKLVIEFFKSKGLNILNFTTFPENKYISLHADNTIDSDIKIKDLFIDLFIATNSTNILSNSKGGFINLLRRCFENKQSILAKLK